VLVENAHKDIGSWFRVLAKPWPKKNGADFDQDQIEAHLKQLDTFYRGSGWSNDGPEGYTQNGLLLRLLRHTVSIYLQLLIRNSQRIQTQNGAQKFRNRARQYADPESRPFTFGRSLTYRSAMRPIHHPLQIVIRRGARAFLLSSSPPINHASILSKLRNPSTANLLIRPPSDTPFPWGFIHSRTTRSRMLSRTLRWLGRNMENASHR